MSRMKITIAGNGIVGGALRRWLIRNTLNHISIYDPPQGYDVPPLENDIVFVSVPVPTKSMKLDFTILHQVLDVFAKTDAVICIRSTVLPGTCDELSDKYNHPIVSMPEFLTERTRDADVDKHGVIAGIPAKYDKPEERDYLARILNRCFEGKKKIRISTARNCEMAKYAHNVFGALKVTYFNGIARQCELKGMDYSEVRELIQTSGLIDPNHTQVPGPDGQRGYGGHCFPKDVAAFLGFLGGDCEHMLIKDVLCLNRFYRGEKPIDGEKRFVDSDEFFYD